MPDGKYGLIYTEKDMRHALAFGIEMAGRDDPPSLGEIEEVVLAELPTTFPADEPLFLLRGQDRLAAIAVESYWRASRARSQHEGDVPSEHVVAAWDALHVFMDWQAAHFDRVKVPD